MKSIKERASDYFKSNPSTAELFGTSDGTLFLEKQHANSHAIGLEDKELAHFTPANVTGNSIKRVVTQEDLDLNPELVANGVVVGDEIEFEAQKVKPAPKAKAATKPATAPKAKAVKAPAAPKVTKPKAAAKPVEKPEVVKTPTEGEDKANENPQ